MKINIRLTAVGDGRWHWTVGRAGVMSRFGVTESHEAAQSAAEETAQEYAEDVRRSQFYLYDTDSHERIGYEEG